MSSQLASLVANLTVETAQWNSNLDKALKKFTDFHDSVASTMLSLAEVLGAGFAVDKVIEFSNQIISSAAALEHLSQETGATVESLAALQGAAQITGIDDLGNSLIRLTRAQGQVQAGNKQVTGAFAAIGISAADVAALKPDELLKRIADAFGQYADGAGKSAVAQQIFGRAGAQMVPLLDEGSAALQRLLDNVNDLGGGTSTAFAKAAADFEGDLARMKLAVGGVGDSIISQLLPSLDGAVKGFTTFIAETQDIDTNFSAFGGTIKSLATGFLTVGYSASTLQADLSNLFEGAGREIGGYAAAIATLVKDGPAAAKKVLQDAHADIQALDDKYRADELKRDTAYSDAIGAIWDNQQKHVAAAAAETRKQVILPKVDTSGVDTLIKALESLRQKAAALDFSDGLKPSEEEAAKASLQVGKLHDAVVKAGAQGPIFAQQILQAASALDKLEAAASVKQLTDQLQQQIDTFGKGSIAVQEYQLTHGQLAKTLQLTADKGVAERASLESLYATLAQRQDASGIEQLNLQLAQASQDTDAVTAATAKLFDLQNQAKADNYLAEGNTQALQALDLTKQRTVAQAAFNVEQQKAADINTQLQAQLAAIAAAQANGSETDIQAMQAQDAARQNAAAGLADIQAHLDAIAKSSGLPSLQNQATQAAAGLTTLQSQTQQLAHTLQTDFVNDASSAFADFIDGTKSAHDAFKSFMDTVFQQISQLVAKNLFQSLFATAGAGGASGGGGGLSGIFQDVAGLFGGGKAGGGAVTAGTPYLIGENGPELMIPDISGQIVPNGRLSVGGGTQKVTQNIYVQGQVTQRSARQLQLQSARQQRIAMARLG